MKKQYFKNCLLKLVRLSVLLVMWAGRSCDYIGFKILSFLDNPLSCPCVELAARQAERNADRGLQSLNPGGKALAGDSFTIKELLEVLALLDDEAFEKVRIRFEQTRAGLRAIKENPDRRLYAVLIPMRQENVKRILNVIYEMDAVSLNHLLTKAKKELSNA